MAICCNKNQGINFRALAKNKITIQSPTEVVDDIGGLTATWENESTVWAVMMPASGKEIFQYQQLESSVSGKIIIKYQASLANTLSTAKKRIAYKNRYHKILAIRNLDKTLKYEGTDYQEIMVD